MARAKKFQPTEKEIREWNEVEELVLSYQKYLNSDEKYKCDEYQKMMSIYVLHKINSPKLEYYLNKSEALNYTFLNKEVKQIREKMKESNR